MSTKSIARLIVLVLLTSFVGMSDLARAQSRDSNSQLHLGQDNSVSQNVRNEFLSRLKDYRSMAHRKESAFKEYAQTAESLNELRQEQKKADDLFATLRSKYISATVIPKEAATQIFQLDVQRAGLSNSINFASILADLSIEEYDLLSRLEDVESGYKGKAISKLDYEAEERRLTGELSQIRIAKELESLRYKLVDGLIRIERVLGR